MRYDHQYGFHKNHPTYMALLELTDIIYTALDNNEYTICIFLDFSKTFHMVYHAMLPIVYSADIAVVCKSSMHPMGYGSCSSARTV